MKNCQTKQSDESTRFQIFVRFGKLWDFVKKKTFEAQKN